jgi:hypothetical protein
MKRPDWSGALAAAAFLAALAAPAGVARAMDEAEAEAVYGRYHQAIEAAVKCRGLEFDQPAHSAMAGVIHARIEHKIGAKRLSLLTAAQRAARDLIDAQGCAGPDVGELLALFDSDLAPALPQ